MQVSLDTAPTLWENEPGAQGSILMEVAEQLLLLQALKYPASAWEHLF